MKHRFAPLAWRVLADALIAFLSLALGFAVRLCFALVETHALPPQQLLRIFLSCWAGQGLLLAATLVGTFSLFGVYTRTRFYTRRFKAVALFQAISLAYGIFLLLVYLSGRRDAFLPRGAFLIAYALTLGLAMGLRLTKAYFERRFTLEPAQPAPERPVQKVLVVGGAGYIGSVLVRHLLAAGYRVRVLDSLDCGGESLRDLDGHRGFQLVQGDFRHVAPVVRAVKGMDAVIHLGAIVGDPACAVNEDETLETNLAATRLLADVCRASGVSRILFASTCSVYGATDHPVDERSRLNPVSLYAATKIDSERVLLDSRDRNFHPVILRLATAFGWSPRPRFDLVVNLLAAQAAVEKKIVIYNGEQWRPFIHVSDIARAFRLALEAPLAVVSGEIFNVGSDARNVTLRELAETVARLRPGVEVEYADHADSRNYRVKFDKIRGALGLECPTTLEAGIREIQDAFGRGLVADYREPRYSNVQLATLRRQEHSNGNGKIGLTALQFAKNSSWWRELAAGASSESLLQSHSTGLASLTRSVAELNSPFQKHANAFPDGRNTRLDVRRIAESETGPVNLHFERPSTSSQ